MYPAPDIFSPFAERRKRCSAVRLSYSNTWSVATFLNELGYDVTVSINAGGYSLEAKRNDQLLSISEGDWLVWDGNNHGVMPTTGENFYHEWEPDHEHN
jgi:hypothetical protein